MHWPPRRARAASKAAARALCCGNIGNSSALHRTEGASYPSEMAAVAAVECPVCGAHGTVVLGYGPGASIDDNDVLTGLTDARNA